MPLPAVTLRTQDSQVRLAAAQRTGRLRIIRRHVAAGSEKLCLSLKEDASEEKRRWRVRAGLIEIQKLEEHLPLVGLGGTADARGFFRQFRRSLLLHDFEQSRQPSQGQVNIQLLEKGSTFHWFRRYLRREAFRELLLQRKHVFVKHQDLRACGISIEQLFGSAYALVPGDSIGHEKCVELSRASIIAECCDESPAPADTRKDSATLTFSIVRAGSARIGGKYFFSIAAPKLLKTKNDGQTTQPGIRLARRLLLSPASATRPQAKADGRGGGKFNRVPAELKEAL